MVFLEKTHTSCFELINTSVLVNSGYLLERERWADHARNLRKKKSNKKNLLFFIILFSSTHKHGVE